MSQEIAKRIRALRKAMKLTQSQFAELVNLSEDSVGKIERGVSVPTIETLKNIAAGLKLPLSELLGEAKHEARHQISTMDDLIKYLRTKSAEDIRLIHKIAVQVLERRKGR